MKKFTLIALMTIAVMAGCENKKEKLQNKTWIAANYSYYTSEKKIEYMEFYHKGDNKNLYLFEDGTCGEDRASTWKLLDEKYIIINNGIKDVRYEIKQLTSTRLELITREECWRPEHFKVFVFLLDNGDWAENKIAEEKYNQK